MSAHTDSEFFRIHLGPSPGFNGRVAWVSDAQEPQMTGDRKRAIYRHLALTDAREAAQVYPEATAAAMISILRSTYDEAALEPATFNDWVEAAGRPGQ